jgi:exodeoxyribonuclease VII small subunit
MPQNQTDSAPGSSGAPETDADLAGLDFETAIEELEALVDQMEAGDLTLEASLVAYERGVRLTRHCQTALRNAELKIKQLTEGDRLEPLDPEAFDDD